MSIHNYNKNANKNTNNNGNTTTTQNQNIFTQANDIDSVTDILINYNQLAKAKKFTPALFRDTQMIQMLSILQTTEHNNPLLIGEAGVGKTKLVEDLALRIVNKDPLTSALLGDKIIYELPISHLIAGNGIVGQLEEQLNDIIEFLTNPQNNAIVFIDEIHMLVDHSNSIMNIITQYLKPALARSDLSAIGATTLKESAKLRNDPAFSRRWNDVTIPELTNEETQQIIKLTIPRYTQKNKVIVPDHLLPQIVAYADEYKQYGSHRPDTALSLIDRTLSNKQLKHEQLVIDAQTDPIKNQLLQAVQQNGGPILTESDLLTTAQSLHTLSQKTTTEQQQEFKHMTKNEIIGQNSAVKALDNMLARRNLNLTNSTKPSSFLFAGPSGTGKTELAKILTRAMFSKESDMIYINMSEYKSISTLNKLLGSPMGYVGSTSNKELPFDSLQTRPFQIVVLDEFEKAHPDIQHLFMQVLDTGVLTDNSGKTIDFKRSTIIATTNAGLEDMQQTPVGFNKKEQTINHKNLTKTLSNYLPQELLNRFESIILFNALTKDDFMKVLAIQYNQIVKEASITRKDLTLQPKEINIDSASKTKILQDLAEKHYNPLFNARPAKRIMREYIENTILENDNQFTINLL